MKTEDNQDTVTHGEVIDDKEKLDIITVTESECDFFFKEKGKYGVLVFSGVLKSNSELKFEEAQDLILKSKTLFIVICLNGVDAINLVGVRCLAVLQKAIRNSGKKLRICGVEDQIRDKLLASGVVREGELKEDIKDAFKGFIKAKNVMNNRSRKKS